MIDTSLIKWAIGGLLSLNLAVLGWAVNYVIKSKSERMEDMAKRQDAQDAEMKKIKDNYLNRFGRVYKKIDDSRDKVMEEIKELRNLLIEHLQRENK